jgi:hypothetical protein
MGSSAFRRWGLATIVERPPLTPLHGAGKSFVSRYGRYEWVHEWHSRGDDTRGTKLANAGENSLKTGKRRHAAQPARD